MPSSVKRFSPLADLEISIGLCAFEDVIGRSHHRRWRKAIGPWYERNTLAHLRTLAIQSVRLPPPFLGLGSVLRYRSRDLGSIDFDEW